MTNMRHFMNLVETAMGDGRSETITEAVNKNLHLQFHMSVEPNLKPMADFAHQTRTVSYAGERGEAGGEGIYTTHNLRHWATQFFFEEPENFPRFIYLVWVKEPTAGSIMAAHQDMNLPQDVIVLAKVGEIDEETIEDDNADPPDYGKMEWAAERWVKQHADILGKLSQL